MSGPNVSLTAGGALALAGVVGLVLLGPMLAKKAGAAAAAAADAVNPLNHDNVFATGVNAVGGALVTDPAGPGKNADGSWTLGGFLYDTVGKATTAGNFATQDAIEQTFNPSQPDPGAVWAGGGGVSNPAGPGMNADGSWSLGGWIYDITH